MAFESDADDEAKFRFFSGRGLWRKAAIAGLLSLSVPLYDLAAEVELEAA